MVVELATGLLQDAQSGLRPVSLVSGVQTGIAGPGEAGLTMGRGQVGPAVVTGLIQNRSWNQCQRASYRGTGA